MKLFKKKVKTQLEKEIKKLPRFRRKRTLRLYEEAKRGKVLVINKDVDNAALMKERS